MHAQKSGTAFRYQKRAPNRAAFYSVQVSGIRKLAQESMSDTHARNLHKFLVQDSGTAGTQVT